MGKAYTYVYTTYIHTLPTIRSIPTYLAIENRSTGTLCGVAPLGAQKRESSSDTIVLGEGKEFCINGKASSSQGRGEVGWSAVKLLFLLFRFLVFLSLSGRL